MTRTEEALLDRLIEAGNVEADRIVGDLCDDVPDEIWGETVYALWVNLTHMLVAMGWTAEQLQGDVAWHEANQTTEGRIQ